MVVTEPAGKRFFAERYEYWLRNRFQDNLIAVDTSSAEGRTIKAAVHLAEHLHEVPALIFCCGKRDWPFAVPAAQRVGLAPPSYGSIYPCVQNILLACRGLGLGASLTTMHQMFEPEMHAFFGIPETYGVVAVIPVGFPSGQFGPVAREPVGPGVPGRGGGSRRRAEPAAGPSARSRTSINPASDMAGSCAGSRPARPAGAGEAELVVAPAVLSISPPHVSDRSRGRCCGQGET